MATWKGPEVCIEYEVVGEGTPIALVHGFASNRRVNWENTGWYQLLARRGRRVITLDLRGHGESSKPHDPQAYFPQKLAQDVVGVLDHLGAANFEIMGYSMGAWVTAHLIAACPERCRAAVLGGMGDIMLELSRGREPVAKALTARSAESVADPYLRSVREFAELLGNDLSALAACVRSVYHGGLPALERAQMPVLFVGAENDEVVGRPDRLAKMVPHPEVALLPGLDHLTAMVDETFKARVIEFLERHGFQG